MLPKYFGYFCKKNCLIWSHYSTLVLKLPVRTPLNVLGTFRNLFQCDQKKSPCVYKSCPKKISLDKLNIFTPLQKLPENEGKLIVAKGFTKLPKVQ